MKKLILTTFFLLFLFLINTNKILAQALPPVPAPGTFFCWTPNEDTELNNRCLENCPYGYESNCVYKPKIVVGGSGDVVHQICILPVEPTACRAAAYEITGDKACVNTALGCIPITKPNDMVTFILRWALGIAGGIAILLVIAAGFIIITSSGDPKKVQGGKELLTAAIAGLVLIIFSTFILRIIGVNILGIL